MTEAVAKQCRPSKTDRQRYVVHRRQRNMKRRRQRKKNNLYSAIPIAKSSPCFESFLKNSRIKGVGKNLTNTVKQKFNFNPKGQEWVWESSSGAGLRATE